MKDQPSLKNREELMMLYQITVSDLTYFKSQQWSLTNYVFLLLAGLIGVNQLLGHSAIIFERIALVVLACGVGLAGVLLLSKLQASIKIRQSRLDASRGAFSPEFIKAWSAEIKATEYIHSIWFLRAAVVVGSYCDSRGLTIRSSRTRIGAPPGCFSATLAPSRHPAAGRLNSGVRRHKDNIERGEPLSISSRRCRRTSYSIGVFTPPLLAGDGRMGSTVSVCSRADFLV
jgi:hypothetical protein